MAKTHTFDCPCGPIIGYEGEDSLIRAKGIPYAQASRFDIPLPVSAWSSLAPFDASEPSPYCPQWEDPSTEATLGTRVLAGLKADENCLCLSITAPASAVSSPKLPVFVWIFGGNYLFGAGDAGVYDPSRLVREQQVIAVTITYRVGFFGYLGDGQTRKANLGLLDQIAALQWVKTNIAGFGGDPDNVTVAGQSAGGDAVIHLLACDNARGLFRRALIQSAPLGLRGGKQEMAASLIKRTRHITRDSSVEEIVQASKDALTSAYRFGIKAAMAFSPQYNQHPLPAEPQLEDAWTRNSPSLDILIGTTRTELGSLPDAVPAANLLFHLPWLGPKLQSSLFDHLKRRIYSDETVRIAQLFADAGANVWLYDFYFSVPGNRAGAPHSIDLALELGDEDVWGNAKFLRGAAWEDVQRAGARYRELLAGFVRGSGLRESEDVEGIVSYRKLEAAG